MYVRSQASTGGNNKLAKNLVKINEEVRGEHIEQPIDSNIFSPYQRWHDDTKDHVECDHRSYSCADSLGCHLWIPALLVTAVCVVSVCFFEYLYRALMKKTIRPAIYPPSLPACSWPLICRSPSLFGWRSLAAFVSIVIVNSFWGGIGQNLPIPPLWEELFCSFPFPAL